MDVWRQSAEGEWVCDNRGRGEREEKGEVYRRRRGEECEGVRLRGGGGFSGESYLIGE